MKFYERAGYSGPLVVVPAGAAYSETARPPMKPSDAAI
jgi:hypothetical protein